MIKVKSFTSQMKIFHSKNELEELDRTVGDFIASNGIRKVISVSDVSTTGDKGETIGLVRVLTYEEPDAGSREHYQQKIESRLDEWGDEIEKLRQKADQLGEDAKARFREQVEDLRGRQGAARRKLEEMKKAGGDAWGDLREGADSALDDLKKAVDSAVSKLRKD